MGWYTLPICSHVRSMITIGGLLCQRLHAAVLVGELDSAIDSYVPR